MTSDAFRDALAKGQGRTALVLKEGDPASFVDTILAACIENLQWDRQCEENRALYVMRLIDLARLQERALSVILKALRDGKDSENGWDRDWMIDLLEEFARRGETQAWEMLRQLAEAGNERAQDNLATANEAGLEWVAANVLPDLPEDELYRIGFWLPDEEEADMTARQRRLRNLDRENDARRDAAWNISERLKPKSKIKTRDFFKLLDAGKTSYGSPYTFARIASGQEFSEAARRLLRETDHRSAMRLAQAFDRRGFPLPLRFLFPHAAHKDRGHAVCHVLGKIDAPQIRHFARRLLKTRPLPWGAVGVIDSSFRPGDEALVASVLPDVETYRRGHLHNVVLDAVGLFRAHPDAAWQPHAEWIYEHSPCSMCRASAVRWMAEHGALADAIREEGAFDAESDIRKAVGSQA